MAKPGRRNGGVRLVALALTAASLVLTGCTTSAGTGNEPSLGDIVRQAIEEAKEQQGTGTGRTGSGSRDVRLDDGSNRSFDYDQYSAEIGGVLGSLDQYWSEALPQNFGVRYVKPRGGFFYYRSDEGGGPKCGDQPAPPKNAFYCPPGDFIAWDESGLLIPYYVQGGDFAAAFVLAHEYGHAMQARLPGVARLPTVIKELQADCFAGAWSQWLSLQDRGLEAGDLDEATVAVFSARDVPGTPFTDPRAHGTGFERTRAFGDGFEGGPRACQPAAAENWVVNERIR
ncbi:MAG: neutral zinc metallopeptidase [Actinomycetota bacterium]|nr:neutral zinc metallopeptidase [Actinomycetota bacterium]